MKKKYWILLFIIYLAALLKITVIRSGFDLTNLFQNGTLNLAPFLDLIDIVGKYGLWRFTYLFIGNIIWFVPFGFLLPVIFNNKLNMLKTVLCGFCLSLIIEFLQFMLGTGFSELDDLILNTFGVFIGYIIYKKIYRRRALARLSK